MSRFQAARAKHAAPVSRPLNADARSGSRKMNQQLPVMEADALRLAHGSAWVRADFHLHTKADKEFAYAGPENDFVADYIARLVEAGIGLGVITNHNKFDADEFKALRKRARREGIRLLPGVELSVADGANGVHTLIAFSDAWLADGNDYINQFLGVAFAGKAPAQYEHENGRTKDDLLTTLKTLEGFNRDFFAVFAHVEAPSGLWHEIDGGRMQELAQNPLVQKYGLGFQKVRTHDKADAKSRVKVKQWWGKRYPAELEGCDAKSIEELGRGQACYLKLGDFGFDAVKYALTDFEFRVATAIPKVAHAHIDAVRFEGGLLNGVRVPFSPHLNCLIGIQGSGKSSILESLRYALNIPFGDKAQDREYKSELLPYVLQSGGKITIEATDRHGTKYEISRILDHEPNVYVDGKLRPGIAIRETIINKPLYFGQKDLCAAGKGFGQDLVEKLVGDGLKPIRRKIERCVGVLETTVEDLLSVQSDAQDLEEQQASLQDVTYQIEQFDKHKLQDQLDKQVEFNAASDFCDEVYEAAKNWRDALDGVVAEAKEAIDGLKAPESPHTTALVKKYDVKIGALKKTVGDAKKIEQRIVALQADFEKLHGEVDAAKDGLKEEFAETERKLVKSLTEQGVTSIKPDAYVKLKRRRAELAGKVADLKKKTAKQKAKADAVLAAVAALNEAWHEEYKHVAASLNKINLANIPLKVGPKFKSDKAAFREKMEEVFRGSGVRKEAFAALVDAYADFGQIYKELDKAAASAKGKAEAFNAAFLENLFCLLSYQVPNSYEVTYHGKPLTSHSLGQRASAMMLFLLRQEEHDLFLIDQPEDDLDSQTVYEEVVKLLRVIKAKRQFIFATHEPNFPVLGDAESIGACEIANDRISVHSGSIDTKECQGKIVAIMEGGVEAFERRKTIYQIWKAD
jgi:chromosome segregation protein